MERDGLYVCETQMSERFHCFPVLQRSHWTWGARRPRFYFLSIPHPFGGQIIIFRAFMMHYKNMVWANIGMNYLVINTLSRTSWHHIAHISSKFGSYCLGDLSYIGNHSHSPHHLSESPPTPTPLVVAYHGPDTDSWQPWGSQSDHPLPFHSLIYSIAPP